jgi:hypothetical protein
MIDLDLYRSPVSDGYHFTEFRIAFQNKLFWVYKSDNGYSCKLTIYSDNCADDFSHDTEIHSNNCMISYKCSANES